ncbi:hypothetical protein BGW80DRAFT_1463515 [Lactifluus volemus]|nr:hypothetical protein BGW80DRAFT_1463515 [Lactifluus volemus]
MADPPSQMGPAQPDPSPPEPPPTLQLPPTQSQPLPAEHPHTLPDATPALLTEAISHVRAELASLKKSEFTFTFFPDSSIAKPELIGCTSAQTNLAIQIVFTLLENGFNPDLPVTPLSTEGWACLCSGLLASMGRGIIRTDINTLDPNDYQRLKETCVDRSPCNTKPNATLFDRISLLARLLSLAIESPADHDPDIEKAKQDHLRLKKREAILHAEKAALDFQLSETARICSYTECDINQAIRDSNPRNSPSSSKPPYCPPSSPSSTALINLNTNSQMPTHPVLTLLLTPFLPPPLPRPALPVPCPPLALALLPPSHLPPPPSCPPPFPQSRPGSQPWPPPPHDAPSFASIAARPPTQPKTNPPPPPTPSPASNPVPPTKPTPPKFTEVTVQRDGGHHDPATERTLRATAPETLVRRVLRSISAAKLSLPLLSGRWSARTANFVYVFAGNLPFSKVTQFSRFLLDPFPSASLVPNHAWSRLIFNGVPCYDLDGTFYEDADLIAEIRKLPSLKTAHLTLAPRWLKPRDRILGNYSSATFAFSDPDHLITDTLFKSPLAMFGKAITVRKFVNRPPLTQCDRCWKLGHMANQPACKLNQDTTRCYICGKSHNSVDHGAKCPHHKQHKDAGICDCRPKCINCGKEGHLCLDPLCPDRENFRRPTARRQDDAASAMPPACPSVPSL